MTQRRYISSSTKKYKFDFSSKFNVAKLNMNGKPDSMVIGPAFMS
jgi:hypothetical protein